MGPVISLSLIMLFTNATSYASHEKYEVVSQEFLYAIRSGDMVKAEQLNTQIKTLNPDSLAQELKNDERKKAFWINCYNAYVIYMLKKDSNLYEDRSAFFTKKRILIAGKELSLDDIEHGILRRSRNKLSLGYLGKLRVPKFEKKFRVKKVDYRIHFALNCGANSCPPVAFYSSDKIEEQLTLAESGFLEESSKVNHEKKEAIITPLMSWFRADFGGKKGIKKILIKNEIIPNKKYSIKFDSYDWTLNISNYKE